MGVGVGEGRGVGDVAGVGVGVGVGVRSGAGADLGPANAGDTLMSAVAATTKNPLRRGDAEMVL